MELGDLKKSVDDGSIDTVLLCIADMEGRLQGKRLTAKHFLDDVVEHGAEGCNYLLAVDVDMNTVGGYEMSSWLQGYGDFVMAPDLSTLRGKPVVAVRVWLRIRADVTEGPFFDGRALNYAGVAFVPTPAESALRRILVERTVTLRNR